MTLELRCALSGCVEPPVLAAVIVSPEDEGDGTYYSMFATCATHQQQFLDLKPADLPPYTLVGLVLS